MANPRSWPQALVPVGRAPLLWLAGWWQLAHFAALMLVVFLSASTWRGVNRRALARHLVQDTAPLLPWFIVLSGLITAVFTRIVLLTAQNYGLSQYALEMLIRVVVLEMIPLTAALFVALRCTVPHGAELARMRRRGELDALRIQGTDPVAHEVLPRVVAGVFSAITLAAVSCVVALVLVYVLVNDFSLAGLPAYSHVFARIFTPSVTLVFVLKTLLSACAVALIPLAAGLQEGVPGGRLRAVTELRGLVRMFAVLLAIEALSLMGNYY